MLDDAAMIETTAQPLPPYIEIHRPYMPEGSTVADIVAAQGLDPSLGVPTVWIVGAERASVVPLDMWRQTRPRRGARVEIGYRPEDPVSVLALTGSALLPSAASAVAGSVLGFASGTFAYAAATAAVTVVGTLALQALIPPGPQSGGRGIDPLRRITGTSNEALPYQPVPLVLGRRRLTLPLAATGYSETVGDDIYWRGRYSLGYGPLTLNDLRLGDTPIEEYDGVEIEFRNVHEGHSGLSDALKDLVVGWRSGTERMRLYPADVTSEGYSDVFEGPRSVVRRTAPDTVEAQIDLAFTRGLVDRADGSDAGRALYSEKQYRIRVRRVGTSAWVDARSEASMATHGAPPAPLEAPRRFRGTTPSQGYSAKSDPGLWAIRRRAPDPFVTTAILNFAEAGQYDIEITRISPQESDEPDRNPWTLTAVRSVSGDPLPSPEDQAEVCIRLKASDQLNGRPEGLNAEVQQLGRVWRNGALRGPEPIRHPAWVYLQLMTGPHLKRPVRDSDVDLDSLIDLAQAEPHWTCDYIAEGDQQLMEVARVVAGTGRTQLRYDDFRYGLLRDQASGPIRGIITPRNARDFEGEITFPSEIHGFRVRVWSERLDQEDEIEVYADGYGPDNATAMETLELPGVVVGANEDPSQGNAWKLGRYQLAQVILRPERFTVVQEWEQIRYTRGDKQRLVYDVPLVGIGQGRVKSVSGRSITLDEVHPVSGPHLLTIQRAGGNPLAVTADAGGPGQWDAQEDLPYVRVGDLVAIEPTERRSLDVLVYSVEPTDDDDRARVTLVPASPEILAAADGEIPPYTPVIDGTLRAPYAILITATSGPRVALDVRGAGRQPRIAVRLRSSHPGESRSAIIRWRRAEDGGGWSYSGSQPIDALFYATGLDEGVTYEIQGLVEGDERSRYVPLAMVEARLDNDAFYADAPTGWRGVPGIDRVALTGDPYNAPDFRHFQVYGAGDDTDDLSFIGVTRTPQISIDEPEGFTRYRVCAEDLGGLTSPFTPFIRVSPRGAEMGDLAEYIRNKIEQLQDLGERYEGELVDIFAEVDERAQQARNDANTAIERAELLAEQRNNLIPDPRLEGDPLSVWQATNGMTGLNVVSIAGLPGRAERALSAQIGSGDGSPRIRYSGPGLDGLGDSAIRYGFFVRSLSGQGTVTPEARITDASGNYLTFASGEGQPVTTDWIYVRSDIDIREVDGAAAINQLVARFDGLPDSTEVRLALPHLADVTEVADIRATLRRDYYTRSDTDEAIASAKQELQSDYNGKFAGYSDQIVTLSDEQQAQAGRISQLQSDTEDTSAAVTNLSQTVSDNEQSFAQDISRVESAAGDAQGQAEVALQTASTVDGRTTDVVRLSAGTGRNQGRLEVFSGGQFRGMRLDGTGIFGGPVQSESFNDDNGWILYQNGDARFNGVVVSRQIQVATGTISFSAGFGQSETGEQTRVIDTGFSIRPWEGSKRTFIAVCGLEGDAAATRYSDSPGPGPENWWDWSAEVAGRTRWFGANNLMIRATVRVQHIRTLDGRLRWRLYEVT